MPAELQRVTVFSAGIAAGSREPDAARELIRFLSSPEAAETVLATGLDPMPEVTPRPVSLASEGENA